ncbi:MAG: FAD-dependent hydroxylase [Leptolyngbyaceae cyanobacterium SL_7_1]|nr:FAD-dependent hydroxylase [Leptolyngbyaceae cyanobacterium SL_7_1]
MVLNLPSTSSVPTLSQANVDKPIGDRTYYDVAIVGGGIVGLTLACALQDSGLRIALIEAKSPAIGLQWSRAYHVTLMSERIFKDLGVWEQIVPHITTFQQIHLADQHCPSVVKLQPTDMGTSALGHVAEHRVLLQALQNKLGQAKNIHWFCPAELLEVGYQPNEVGLKLAIDGEIQYLQTGLLVAADGSRSPIRQNAHIQTRGWQYWQSCITAVIQPERSHQNIAREHFWADGPFATLPLPNNRAQIVLTAPHQQAKELMELDESAFLAELNRRYDGQLGKLALVGDRFLFPVQLMHSNSYVRPRLALVGDAAHCCHPVGGQGLNLGIRDAVALAQVLDRANQKREDIGSLQVLRRYERWRRFENLMILGFTDVLDRTFSSQWIPLVVARRLGLRLMQTIPTLRYLALRLMTGLSGRQPRFKDPY